MPKNKSSKSGKKNNSRSSAGTRPKKSLRPTTETVFVDRSIQDNDNLPDDAHDAVEYDLTDRHRKAPQQFDQFIGDILPAFAVQSRATYAQRDEESMRIALESNESTDHALAAWMGSFGNLGAREVTTRLINDHESPHSITETIFGTDDRVRVHDTLDYPYSALCHLITISKSDTRYVGTGWLIDPWTVVTAGHCVFKRQDGGWAKSVQVYPARNGTEIPFSRRAARMMSVKGWTENGWTASDYGAIRLSEPIEDVGTLGFRVDSTERLLQANCHVVGYPFDKGGQMWGHVRRLRSASSNILVYDIDTKKGNSGGPVMYVENGTYWAVGIHNYGKTVGNSATRITNQVFDQLESWKKN